jgi:2-succinyl-6-hydroxy-2,4-cyclohexadiene-1-carboxylate synthase
VRVPEDLVLLHGFAGTSATWDDVVGDLPPERYTPLALDLPGHGAASDTVSPITFASCVQYVLDASPPRFALCGYSLGGRIALHLALAAPWRIERLTLISCTAGIEAEAERAVRREADRTLAERLEHHPLGEFMDRWQAQPIFAEDPPEVHAAMRAQQACNSPRALAEVLRGVGAGAMVPLWDRLSELSMPVGVLVGERDTKYHEVGRRMARLLPDARLSIVAGGHRLPLENAKAVIDAL